MRYLVDQCPESLYRPIGWKFKWHCFNYWGCLSSLLLLNIEINGWTVLMTQRESWRQIRFFEARRYWTCCSAWCQLTDSVRSSRICHCIPFCVYVSVGHTTSVLFNFLPGPSVISLADLWLLLRRARHWFYWANAPWYILEQYADFLLLLKFVWCKTTWIPHKICVCACIW